MLGYWKTVKYNNKMTTSTDNEFYFVKRLELIKNKFKIVKHAKLLISNIIEYVDDFSMSEDELDAYSTDSEYEETTGKKRKYDPRLKYNKSIYIGDFKEVINMFDGYSTDEFICIKLLLSKNKSKDFSFVCDNSFLLFEIFSPDINHNVHDINEIKSKYMEFNSGLLVDNYFLEVFSKYYAHFLDGYKLICSDESNDNIAILNDSNEICIIFNKYQMQHVENEILINNVIYGPNSTVSDPGLFDDIIQALKSDHNYYNLKKLEFYNDVESDNIAKCEKVSLEKINKAAETFENVIKILSNK